MLLLQSSISASPSQPSWSGQELVSPPEQLLMVVGRKWGEWEEKGRRRSASEHGEAGTRECLPSLKLKSSSTAPAPVGGEQGEEAGSWGAATSAAPVTSTASSLCKILEELKIPGLLK